MIGRRRVAVIALVLAGAGAAACAGRTTAGRPVPSAPGRGQSWTDSVLAAMTLREKAAQMVWPTVLGDYVAGSSPQWGRIRDWIAGDRVGGFTMSVGSPIEIAAKLNAMQRLSRVPLLVGADLEFGAGYRARGGYFVPNAIDLGGAVVFPPEMALGAADDTALAYEQGRLTAIEGRAIGIHVTYAPVLDVNNNPDNPVINTRSYGEDPARVAALGSAFIRGIESHGMLATGKHFPGHGDTDVNSHLALPVIRVSRARLDTVELVPFRAAIRAGVAAIMSFHGSMPALDSSGVPGTLSSKVLGDVLRGELGFQGLVISDAMDMRGVLDQFGAEEATKRAVAAGADILIQPLDVTRTIDAVVAGVAERRYPESRVDASVRRILEAKRSLGLDRRRLVDVDSVPAMVADSGHVTAARLAAERSITLVRDSLRAVPLSRLNRGARVLSITVARRADLPAGATFDEQLRARFDAARSEFVDLDSPENGASYWRLLQAADSADVVLVSSYITQRWDAATAGAPASFVEFVRQLTIRGARPIVISFGNPYLLRAMPDVPAYLVAWGGFPVMQRAAARALLGLSPISGRLPITISSFAPRGAGEIRTALSPP